MTNDMFLQKPLCGATEKTMSAGLRFQEEEHVQKDIGSTRSSDFSLKTCSLSSNSTIKSRPTTVTATTGRTSNGPGSPISDSSTDSSVKSLGPSVTVKSGFGRSVSTARIGYYVNPKTMSKPEQERREETTEIAKSSSVDTELNMEQVSLYEWSDRNNDQEEESGGSVPRLRRKFKSDIERNAFAEVVYAREMDETIHPRNLLDRLFGVTEEQRKINEEKRSAWTMYRPLLGKTKEQKLLLEEARIRNEEKCVQHKEDVDDGLRLRTYAPEIIREVDGNQLQHVQKDSGSTRLSYLPLKTCSLSSNSTIKSRPTTLTATTGRTSSGPDSCITDYSTDISNKFFGSSVTVKSGLGRSVSTCRIGYHVFPKTMSKPEQEKGEETTEMAESISVDMELNMDQASLYEWSSRNNNQEEESEGSVPRSRRRFKSDIERYATAEAVYAREMDETIHPRNLLDVVRGVSKEQKEINEMKRCSWTMYAPVFGKTEEQKRLLKEARIRNEEKRVQNQEDLVDGLRLRTYAPEAIREVDGNTGMDQRRMGVQISIVPEMVPDATSTVAFVSDAAANALVI